MEKRDLARPSQVEACSPGNQSTVTVKRAIPRKIPTKVTQPSIRPDTMETTEVPGQRPLMMNPIPRRKPPTAWAGMKVGLIQTMDMSTKPTEARP